MIRFLLFSMLLLSACSTVNNNIRAPISETEARDVTSYARSLIGVHYKYGGNSPEIGFDCSGFVDHVFRHTLGIRLPRSSYEISHIGHAIGADDLSTGDLVFFNTLHRKFSHVGIYLGGDRFIHAPSSGGSVRTENLLDPYWKTRYDGARRITMRS